MKKISILFLLVCSIGMNTVKSQQNIWNLQDCIAKGKQNSIAIKIERLNVLKAEKNKQSVASTLLPNVRLFGSQNYNFGSTIDPATNSRISQNIQSDNFNARASIDIIHFGNLADARQSKIALQQAEANQKVVNYNYTLQIIERYYQALFTQELLKIQENQLKNALFNLNRIQNEVKLGNKPKSDLYDIKLRHTQEEKRILQTQQLLEMQKIDLLQLLNDRKINVSSFTLATNSLFTTTEISNAYQHPNIALATLNYKSSLLEVKKQWSYALPYLSAYYNISSFYYKPLNKPSAKIDDFSTQLKNNKNQIAGLQLTIPIFNGFKTHKRIASSKIEAQKHKLLIEEETIKIQQKIDLETRKKAHLKTLQKKLDTAYFYAKASFNTTQAKFENGKIETPIYTSVKNQLLNAEYELLKNKLELQLINKKIDVINGKLEF